MATLINSGATLADANSFALSTWVRCRSTDLTSSAKGVAIFQFGPRQSTLNGSALGWNGLDYVSFGSAPTTVFSGLMARSDNTGGTFQICGSSERTVNGPRVFTDTGSPPNQLLEMVPSVGWFQILPIGPPRGPANDFDNDFIVNAWMHLACSVRINSSSWSFVDFGGPFSRPRYTINSTSDANLMRNGVFMGPNQLLDSQISPSSPNAVAMDSSQIISGDGSKRFLPATTAFGSSAGEEYTHMGGGSLWTEPFLSPEDPKDPIATAQFDMVFNDYNTGPFSVETDGGAPPLFVDDLMDGTLNPRLEYGDTYFWPGQYIDWTNVNNLTKVVKITGATGTPQVSTIAFNAFGTPAIYLKGNASATGFYHNRGSAGIMTKTGTITDFTPTPSYG